MHPFLSSLDTSTLSAWRGQLAATGKRLGMRTYLLQHRQELLPRFAAVYRQLRVLPRRLRKALQRRWRLSLAGVALTLTLQPLASEAATFTAGTAAELVTALNTANSTAEADTITLTADITLDTADNMTYGPTGLPVVSSALTIAGKGHTIRREPSDPDQFRLVAINGSGNLTLQDTTLSGGRSDGPGGGIFNRGQLTLEECTVSGNSAGGSGGGIYSFSPDRLTLERCTVSGNTAGDSGGGVWTQRFGQGATITSSTINGNTAGRDGGGVEIRGFFFNELSLTNSTVSGNMAGGDGGGVWSAAPCGSTVTLTNSTVSGNMAGGAGGGGFFRDRNVRIRDSARSSNTGREGSGGGVSSTEAGTCYYAVGAGPILLNHNLFSGNIAPTGAEAFLDNLGGSISATLSLFGHNGLTTAQAFSGVPAGSDNIIATSDGNKPTALADILDTTLRNNGGPTLTSNLVPNSPAIDAAGATCDLTTDQRGAPRPVDGNGDGVAACDIGAVEFGAFPSSLDCSTATASVKYPRLGNRHRYPVKIFGMTDPQNTVNTTITSIFQDEPVINPTGKTCPDGVGVGTDVAKVRNERLLAGDGRVYHIGFTATDSEGASCTGEVQVCVPAKEGEACGDQGALFDSTVCP